MLRYTASRTLATMRAARSFVASRPCAFVVAKTSMVHHPATTSTLRPFSLAASKNISNPEMMCRQCEQTKDHYACTTVGVCGKTAETSAMQDTLSHAVKSVSLWANSAREAGATEEQLHAANVWTLRAVFSTLTNVNFSEERIAEYIQEGMVIKKDLEKLSTSSKPVGPVAETPLLGKSLQELEEFGHSVSIPKRLSAMGDEDCFSLNEIATYGARGTFDMVPSMGCDYWQDFANDAYRIRNNLMTRKRGTSGACAYAAHCYQMGKMDHSIMEDLHKVFCKLASDEPDMEGLLANVLKVGEINGRVLAMLDDAHATTFGAPEPTPVKMTATEGKAILVSGHDMVDLEALLQQTEGKGVNVYTHGEMLPAHSYPGLKKYKHLVGNYGTAWQNQKFEFATFPGPIIVTTNCVQAPRSSYRDRLYTMNEVGVDGVGHIGEDRDFSKVIEQAKSMKGFKATIEPTVYHTVGFNHRAVLPLAKQVIDAAQSGALSRIVLIGGCDGSQHDRNYFTELAEELPDDTLILTLGCAKNRFIRSEKLMGATLSNGMPRILDMGQCNDSYSAVVVATELAKALGCTVNDLPLSLALSHLEQKAAAVLLTLLNMGIKNIRLGPSLPAYITPNVLNVLVENYNLMPTTNAQDDVQSIMAGK